MSPRAISDADLREALKGTVRIELDTAMQTYDSPDEDGGIGVRLREVARIYRRTATPTGRDKWELCLGPLGHTSNPAASRAEVLVAVADLIAEVLGEGSPSDE